MADPKEVARLLKSLIAGVGGAITQGAQGTTQGTIPGRPDLVPLGADRAVDNLGLIYEQDPKTGTWTHYSDSGSLTDAQRELMFGGGNVQMVGSATGGYYQYDPNTGQWNLAIGGTGTGGADPLVAQLRQQQIVASQQQEAREQEMQPYAIAQTQAATEASRSSVAYNEANLARQTLQDQFTRAYDAFEGARLAESLANEKKRTATTLLASIVDNLVPQGMTSLPGIPGSTMPVVGNINWNNITTGLNPETDAALRYLMGLQQQNAGV